MWWEEEVGGRGSKRSSGASGLYLASFAFSTEQKRRCLRQSATLKSAREKKLQLTQLRAGQLVLDSKRPGVGNIPQGPPPPCIPREGKGLVSQRGCLGIKPRKVCIRSVCVRARARSIFRYPDIGNVSPLTTSSPPPEIHTLFMEFIICFQRVRQPPARPPPPFAARRWKPSGTTSPGFRQFPRGEAGCFSMGLETRKALIQLGTLIALLFVGGGTPRSEIP